MFTFTDNPAWRGNITSVKVGDRVITELLGQTSPGDYVFGSTNVAPPPVELDEGINFIAFNPTLFPNNEKYIITIKSSGYPDVTLTLQGPIASLL
ncbi:hemoblobin-interacting domain-containing protein [Brevibacillus sp. SIMBA_040]|uniref:hemoblobin-interacting domain-containing protein n=1 Tax=unclassified Brevibacillus TaxID=2684853 RepID=UPI00397AACE1